MVTWVLATLLIQDVQSQSDRIRAAMAASLDLQRASVRRQIESAHGIAALPRSFAPTPCEPIPEPELTPMIEDVAHRQDIDPDLVREVARRESGFYPCAVSPKGAEGLMQLMPATQSLLKVSDPFSAQESLNAGSRLLKQLLDRYQGDISLALSAYNAGAGRVDKAGGIPQIPETMNYVADILGRLKQ
jgi:soluble lytic murein transglycosylase-like protein